MSQQDDAPRPRRSSDGDAIPSMSGAAAPRVAPRWRTARWVAANLHYSGFIFSFLLFVAGGVITVTLEPTKRPIQPGDPSISLPHEGTRVPITLVFATCMVSSLAILLGEIFDSSRGHTRAMRIRHGVQLAADMVTASLLTVALTMFVKMATGAPRPDLLTNCPTGEDCEPDQLQAFPSGHTAMSFAWSAYAGFYLFWAFYIRGLPPLSEWHWHALPPRTAAEAALAEAALEADAAEAARPVSVSPALPRRPASALSQASAGPMVRRSSDDARVARAAARRFAHPATCGRVCRDEALQVGRLAAILLPQGLAFAVGVSRYLNNRHSLLDITAGALLGTLVAFFVFLRSVLLMERAPRSPVPDCVPHGAGAHHCPEHLEVPPLHGHWVGSGVGSFAASPEPSGSRTESPQPDVRIELSRPQARRPGPAEAVEAAAGRGAAE